MKTIAQIKAKIKHNKTLITGTDRFSQRIHQENEILNWVLN